MSNWPISAERGVRPWSWLLALGVHGLFIAVLVVGVSWQRRVVSTPLQAELWSELPAPATSNRVPPPSPNPEQPSAPPPTPAPAPPVPHPAEQPPLKPATTPPIKASPARTEAAPPAITQASKSDIALEKKQRQEQERAKLALKRQKELEEQLRQERAEAAQEKKQDDARRALNELRHEQQVQLAQAVQAAKAAQIDRYKLAIINKIKNNTEVPEGVPDGTTLDVDVTILPTGEVLTPIKIVQSSGNAQYDQAVIRGIMRSQPLPLPPDMALRRDFRTTHLQLRHEK